MALDRLDGRRHTFGLLLADLLRELAPRVPHLSVLRRAQPVVGVDVQAPQILLPRFLENHYVYSAAIGAYLERLDINLVHYPALFVPYFWNSPSVRKVVTVHGTARASLASDLVNPMWRIKQARIAQGLAECDAVVTVSERSKQDLIERFGLPPQRLHVVYNGVGSQFHPGVESDEVLERLGIWQPYILILSTIKPKKNIVTALRAFARVRSRGLPHHLVLAGYKVEGYRAVDEAIVQLELEAAVHQTGFISNREVPALYAGADCVLVPSLHEGFGLPVIEAYASGCPVVSSNAFALPEIAGDAALLCDPLNSEEMAHGLERVLVDRDLKARLVERGLARARFFSWERAAEALLRVYDAVLRG